VRNRLVNLRVTTPIEFLNPSRSVQSAKPQVTLPDEFSAPTGIVPTGKSLRPPRAASSSGLRVPIEQHLGKRLVGCRAHVDAGDLLDALARPHVE
jgi:hypothetical protein